MNWKERAAELTLRVRETRARLSSAEEELRSAREHLAALRREAPAVGVTREAFTQRRHTLSARREAQLDAGREERLLQASPRYRAALEADPEGLSAVAHRITLDGLAWWFPITGEPSVHQAWIDKQCLPYHGILRTRDLALGGIMLDLGANVGRMAIPRVILGDVMAAYCAEPDPVTFACLTKNVVENGMRGLVLPDQTALGDRDGTVRLLRAGTSGGFRVVPDSSANTVEVPCSTLDTWVERLGIDLEAVTFIKVDVEGYERRLVAGACRVLERRHIAWQMEIKPAGLRAVGDSPQALYDALEPAFTHFIDLNRRATGALVRAIAELPAALSYIEPDGKTDVLLFSAGGALTPPHTEP